MKFVRNTTIVKICRIEANTETAPSVQNKVFTTCLDKLDPDKLKGNGYTFRRGNAIKLICLPSEKESTYNPCHAE